MRVSVQVFSQVFRGHCGDENQPNMVISSEWNPQDQAKRIKAVTVQQGLACDSRTLTRLSPIPSCISPPPAAPLDERRAVAFAPSRLVDDVTLTVRRGVMR